MIEGAGRRGTHPARGGRSRQGGVALLLMLSLLVVVSSTVLISRLNSATRDKTGDIRETAAALASAKAALIAFAATYPDNYPTASNTGPGFLPCPDSDGDGSPNPPCGPSAIGRLPEEFLRLGQLRDADGERIWYALSDSYRNNPKAVPLNSETQGQLVLDGSGDVVAVLIAPGRELDGQSRGSAPDDPASYLEGENADGDDEYTARGAGVPAGKEFNDTVLAITRTELMAAVERRVLAEAAVTLRRYRDASWNTKGGKAGVYPWLTAYSDPDRPATGFLGSVGVRAGHLAFHVPDALFPAGFKADWDVNGAVVQVIDPPGGFPSSVSAGDLTRDEFTVAASCPAESGEGCCVWRSDPQVFDCVAVRAVTASCLGESNVSIDRVYHFVYSGSYETKRPKSDKLRRREAKADSDPFPPATDLAIDVVDLATSGSNVGATCGSGSLRSDGDTGGKFKLKDVPYYLAVPGELPLWFIAHRWHQLVYVAEADAASPAGGGKMSCMPGVNCLVVGGRAPGDDVEALAVIAGAPLAAQDRSGGAIESYFELDNSDGDGVFTRVNGSGDRPPFAVDLNDQIRVISSVSGP